MSTSIVPGHQRTERAHRAHGTMLTGVLVALALLAAACGGGEVGEDPEPPASEDRIISNVWSTDDTNRIDVGWFATSCEAFDSIAKTEFDDKVELRLKAFVDSDNCTKPGTVVTSVDLDQPLGDRLVYDVNPFVNNTVVVEPPR